MRTITTNIYTFAELPQKAKDYAVNKARDWIEFDACLDCYEEELESAGFLQPKINYTGFNSQGDGASFDARIDKERFLVGKYEELKGLNFEIGIESISSSRYVHEKTKRIDVAYYQAFTELQQDLIADLADEIEQLRLDMCHKIYSSLEADYDHQTSYESLSEFLEMNEFEFTIDGKQV